MLISLLRRCSFTSRQIHHPVSELVQEVLDTLRQPWPEDITDQVCLAIEKNDRWLNRYRLLAQQHGKHAINSQIGRSTLALTGFRNLGQQTRATSRLIKTFTRLG
jgi:hypothetical protein